MYYVTLLISSYLPGWPSSPGENRVIRRLNPRGGGPHCTAVVLGGGRARTAHALGARAGARHAPPVLPGHQDRTSAY